LVISLPICNCNIHPFPEIGNRKLQEVLFGSDPVRLELFLPDSES
jgi:hypothetical protein